MVTVQKLEEAWGVLYFYRLHDRWLVHGETFKNLG